MADDDFAYFRRRAEMELDQAQHGTHPKAVKAHHELAEAYLERAAALASNERTGGGPR